jgi:hypothetical protein
MLPTILPLFAAFAASAVLFASSPAPESPIVDLDGTAATSQLETAPPVVTATLYISYAGNGYYNVVIDGHASAANATVGVRVYGDDPWFDDFLFSIIGYARTDFAGNFNVRKQVYRSTLDEDWEGQDEIYAIAEVSGAGSVRTNKISQYF